MLIFDPDGFDPDGFLSQITRTLTCFWGSPGELLKLRATLSFIRIGDPAVSLFQGWGALKLAEAVSSDAASPPEFEKLFPTEASELGLLAEACDSAVPTAKQGRLAENAGSIDRIWQFAQAGAKLDCARWLRACDAGGRSAKRRTAPSSLH